MLADIYFICVPHCWKSRGTVYVGLSHM